MTIREDQPRPMFVAPTPVLRKCFRPLKTAAVWLSEWFSSCADHYAAARMYECLSRLSDADLDRRGLSRATLAHDLIRRCDRTGETNTATIETEHVKEDRARTARPGEAARPSAGADNFDRRSA